MGFVSIGSIEPPRRGVAIRSIEPINCPALTRVKVESMTMTFDITIPVLNEEATLEKQVGILYSFLQSQYPEKGQWKIFIADNGSTDRTREIGKTLEAKMQGVHLLTVPKKGVGLALKHSWAQSQADIVGYMDLDLATDLRHFPETYHAIANEGYDLVYATRLHPKSRVIGRTLKREIASRVFNGLLRGYMGIGFSDGMCGFKFLKREAFHRLYERGARNDGWFFSTELLIAAEWLKMRMYELPVTWTDDVSSSKVRIIPLAKRYWRDMREMRKKR